MATPLLFIVLVAALSYLAPQLTRRDIFFGVTVPPNFRDTPVGRTVSRRYAFEVWGFATVVALLNVTSPMPSVSGLTLWVQTIAAGVAFIRAWSSVRPHAVAPVRIREAAIGTREGLPGGPLAQLGPFLILTAATVYVALNWDAVPDRFPTHWNLAGTPDGWTEKSVGGVFRGLAIGYVVCAMSVFTSYAVLHWARLPRVTGVEGAQHRRVRRANLVASLSFAYLVAVLLAWSTVVAMFADDARALRLPLAIRVAPFILFIVGTLAIRVMRRGALPAGQPLGDTTPDSCWFLGRLYVNRADPALFVERRMGLGYTLNVGNPWSWVVMIVFVSAIAIPLLIVP